ncbi:outer membrane protein assembly complex, YaeT protein [Denitrovibrio acetiphilus DSM 12809]|uniref:Outer membrane protein assembly factor BamA n=1 Tax=Denitrovibrio acetiphilus (strain DSM 12809 / NBRC 114555 / N2460) TaxID=522772 RepID=D4H335_DENA2|nr:outer membrane protein assembly factor BamA [Denitrovibrio acetiphilus]ADD69058.1 outer membrane protein assembly complex, YaeT protein [Denitrovibrio acetiphilus DSM 12809]
MKKYFFFIALIILFAVNSYAATIDDVVVEGNRRVPTNTILKYTVNPGDEFSLADIDNSIKNLFSADIITDVKVDMRLSDDRLILAYVVKEKPYVNRVIFNGNVELKTSVLNEILVPMTGQVIDSRKVETNLKIVEDKYHDEKFYSVDITAEIEDRGNNSVDVVYLINEGVEAKITQINVVGNNHFKRKEILKEIETSEKGFWSFFTGSGKLKKTELAVDMEKIKAMYLREGYAKIQVGEPRIELSEDKKKIVLTIVIEEGLRFKVAEVEFEGYKSVEADALRETTKLKTGDWFNVEEFQDDVKRVTAKFTDIGYAYANVNPVTILNDESQTVSVKYQIEENQLVYINRINIRGNTKSRDRVIRREFDLTEGDLYSSSLITASKNHLEFTDYFGEVRLSETPVASDKVDLDVDVTDKMTGMFSIGAGYSTVDAVTGMVSLTQKNLFGMGYQTTLKAEFSEKKADYTFSITNPWLFDRPYSLGFDLFKTDRSYYEYDKESMGAAVSLGHQLIKRKLYANYRLRYEVIDINDIDEDAAKIVWEQEGESTTISLTPTLRWTTLNHPQNPTAGNKAVVYSKIAGGIFGGDNDFVKIGLSYTHYIPLFWKFVFMGNFEGGQVEAYGGKDVPVAERYRLGGMYSVRGYDYGDVSPLDEDGDRLGGVKYDQMNLEVIFPVVESAQLMGVFFIDAAQSLTSNEQFLSGDVYKSYGAGFRWYSPVGPLRLEYGVPVDDPNGEDPSGKWEFSIGGMF